MVNETREQCAICDAGGLYAGNKKAFEILPETLENLENPKYKSLYEAFIETQNAYEFYMPPQLDNYLELETSFEKNCKKCASAST